MFKIGSGSSKSFFEDKEHFKALLDCYNKYLYRFKLKRWAKDKAPKILERSAFDCDPVKDLKGYMVKLSKFANYAQIFDENRVNFL